MKDSIKKTSFSLVELLVSLSILLILISLLSPSLKNIHLGAQDIQCTQNLREWGMMHAEHEEDFDGMPIHVSMYTPKSSKKQMNWPQYINYYVTGNKNLRHGLSWCTIEDSIDGKGYGMNQKFGVFTSTSKNMIYNTQYIHPSKSLRMVDTSYFFFRGNIDVNRHDRISLRHRFNTNALYLDGHASLEFAQDLVDDPNHFIIR